MILEHMDKNDIDLCNQIVEDFRPYWENHEVEVGNYNNIGFLIAFVIRETEWENELIVDDSQLVTTPKALFNRLMQEYEWALGYELWKIEHPDGEDYDDCSRIEETNYKGICDFKARLTEKYKDFF